jgi:predicted acetyltransferase
MLSKKASLFSWGRALDLPTSVFQEGGSRMVGKGIVVNYRHLQHSELDSFDQAVAASFNTPLEMTRSWIEASGLANWRVVAENETLLGGLMLIPMGQWFGGRAVSSTGLAGVVVDASARGLGVGKHLVAEALSEMRANGAALSALYGSTTSFYRRRGYERAGATFQVEVNLKEIAGRSGPLEIRVLTEAEKGEVESLQRGWVRGNACLDRGPYLWHRVRQPRGVPAEQFGFFSGDRLEGYVFWKRSEFKGLNNELEITDLVLTTPESQQTFLGFLAGHRAFFDKARWLCASSAPWVLALDEPWNFKINLLEHWMLRLVNVQKALEDRGYPPGLPGQIHFEVQDPLFPDNSGCWLLEVGDREGRVTRGGKGTIKLDIGAFAALYTGFLSATQLAVSGKLTGPTEQLSLADQIFRGEPRLCDFF